MSISHSTRTHPSFTKIRSLAAPAIVGLAIVGGTNLVAAPAAHAASSNMATVAAPGARADVTYSAGSWGDITGGRLYDTNRSDAKCARIYEQGYNFFLGGNGWNKLAEVCAGGSVAIPARHYSTYSDHVDVKVCAGTATSGSACTVRRLW